MGADPETNSNAEIRAPRMDPDWSTPTAQAPNQSAVGQANSCKHHVMSGHLAVPIRLTFTSFCQVLPLSLPPSPPSLENRVRRGSGTRGQTLLGRPGRRGAARTDSARPDGLAGAVVDVHRTAGGSGRATQRETLSTTTKNPTSFFV